MTTRFCFTLPLMFLMPTLGMAVGRNDKQQDRPLVVKAFPSAEGFGASPQADDG